MAREADSKAVSACAPRLSRQVLLLALLACLVAAVVPAAAGAAETCAADQVYESLRLEDFENPGQGLGWEPVSLADGSARWHYPPPAPGDLPYSGRLNLWGDPGAGSPAGEGSPITASDTAIEMTSDLALPTGAYLSFVHRFRFAGSTGDRHQGGVLEYSRDAGATWADAGSLFDGADGGGYNGELGRGTDPARPNPLAGRRGFVGDSTGYRSSRLRLTDLAGQQLRFRFRLATAATANGSDADEFRGWAIDDLRLYRCGESEPAVADGAEPQQRSRRGLVLRVRHRPRAVRRGQKAVLRVVARNSTAHYAIGTRICFRAPRRLVAGVRCSRVGVLPAGATAEARFPIRVLPRARPGMRIPFRVVIAARGHGRSATLRRIPVLRSAPGVGKHQLEAGRSHHQAESGIM